MFQKFMLWCYTDPYLEWFRNAKYAIPVIQSFHLAGITAVLGIVCLLALRLLGIGMLKLPLATLWRELAPWFLGGLIITVSAGILQGIIDPTRYLANTPFRIKMAFLAVSIIFHYTVLRRAARNAFEDGPRRTTPARAILGIASLFLWFSVGWGGRMIAFFN